VLTLQEISDRLEIQELLVRYSHAVDTADWEAFERVFTPDARIDYTAMGGVEGGVKEVREWLESVMTLFAGCQHLVSNTVLGFHGADVAHARTICHNPLVVDRADGGSEVMWCGLWYLDVLVRTQDGWRISERREERCYSPVAAGSIVANDRRGGSR